MDNSGKKDLRTLGMELSRALEGRGEGWRVADGAEFDRVTLEAANGAAFTLWGSRYDHRLGVSGRFPMDAGKMMSARDWGVIRYDEKAPEITVSRSRDALVMARDIATRFLTRYMPLYAEALAKKGFRGDERNRRDALARKLAEILGVSPRQFQGEADRSWTLYADGLDITVSGAESVTVAVRCGGEFAEKLTRFYRDNV